ncbi:MAG: hypothetical protein IJ826_04335, partial [Bacteroidaceae bacterium]|nr:hypothetical protein [Bacteroidaceae bacterium]
LTSKNTKDTNFLCPAEIAEMAEIFNCENPFRKLGHFVPLFCYRHEAGHKQASTIFLPIA